jgi:hypothetical protein
MGYLPLVHGSQTRLAFQHENRACSRCIVRPCGCAGRWQTVEKSPETETGEVKTRRMSPPPSKAVAVGTGTGQAKQENDVRHTKKLMSIRDV